MSLNIVAGENIPFLKEAFLGLGNLRILPGRSLSSADLHNTDILLIRSITPVNETLLKDTPVKFVGSASAGTDHMDTAYLEAHNIEFASASGSNANSVAEYVIAALLLLSTQHKFVLKDKTIGIIGVGNIGKIVKQKAEALGMRPILNDPFLAERGAIAHHSLEEVLCCDVVTLHTPLTTDGPYPTYHLLNTHTFKRVKPTAIFINAARGEVVDTSALLNAITHKQIGPTIIDVWEHEPHIHWDLFQAVTLGTPHIAGHSLDGKANGTFMIYTALCKHLDIGPTWHPVQSLPPPIKPSIHVNNISASHDKHLHDIISQIYDIQADYRRMKEISSAQAAERPTLFDKLRRNYPARREFHHTQLRLLSAMQEFRKKVARIGFSEINKEH